MKYSFWIQNSDFSSPDAMPESTPFQSVEHFMSVFGSYDWASQNTIEDQLEESCPAGIGLVKKPGTLLHICPDARTQTCLIHLHVSQKTRIFGFIPITPRSHVESFTGLPFSIVEESVKQFIEGNYTGLRTLFQSEAKPS